MYMEGVLYIQSSSSFSSSAFDMLKNVSNLKPGRHDETICPLQVVTGSPKAALAVEGYSEVESGLCIAVAYED